MQGFFVYHSHLKIGKIINCKNSDFLVHFFGPPGKGSSDCRFAKDSFNDGDLQRIHLPLGTRCRANGDECVVDRVVKYASGAQPAIYEVSVESRNLKRQVAETDLDPLEIVRADPLLMLASHQQEGYPLFRSREKLRTSLTELVRQGGGLRALLASRIDLRPHQAYVAGIVLQDRLRRYLLADEVGLGKTVESGIVIQDLLSIRPDARVLILCPGALTQQWLCELYSKFNYQVFTLLELHGDPTKLPLERRRKVIAPLHAALGPTGEWIAKGQWDLVVVDEVHHLLASQPLFTFVEALSRSAVALLLLSALPAQRRKDDFLQLLSLLEPHRYAGTPPHEFHLLYDSQTQIGRLLRRLRRRLESDQIDRDEVRHLGA